MNAVEQSVMLESLNNPTFKPSECQIYENGNLLCDGIEVKVEVKGSVPESGTIKYANGEIIDITLMYDDKTITRENGKLVYLKAGLYDAEGKLIATWDELVNDYGIDLEKDVEPQVNENGEIINLSEIPGAILSNDEKLSKGTKIVIDSSVKKLGSFALAMNTTLKETIIPNSVISIGIGAFGYSTSLEEITIPDSVTSIGDSVFYGCTSLKEITIGDGLTDISESMFTGIDNLEKLIIGNGVKSIGDSAFHNSTNLKEVVIGNNVESIGYWAFAVCTNLEKVIIGNGVKSIGEGAFGACPNLIEVSMGNSVMNIEKDAFNECTSLTSIIIPESVTKIGQTAFYGCKNLKTINYVGTQEKWDSISKGTNWNQITPSDMVINYNYVIPQN